MGSTFRIYGAHPSMCTYRHTIGEFLKIDEISGLGPLRSEGFVPLGCTYWGAPHGGFIAPGTQTTPPSFQWHFAILWSKSSFFEGLLLRFWSQGRKLTS